MTAPSGRRTPSRPAGEDDEDPTGRRAVWWPRAERRRRVDLLAIALIVVAAVVGTLLVLRAGDESSTTLRPANPPLAQVVEAPVPTALAPVWRAANPAGTPPGADLLAGPTVVGPAVAVGRTDPDGSGVVTGLDAATGAPAWEYRRPEPLCTLGSGFGEVLALFRTTSPVGTYCSDVATIDPSSGQRGPTRNADVRPGTRLLSDGSHVTATGRDYLEVWRDDLVATLEYGALPTPVQSTPQPRANCPRLSEAVGDDSVAVLERCPGEASDRLSVLTDSPAEYDKPEDRFSVLSGVSGGRLVAVADDRVALEAPDRTLRIYDGAGTPIGTVPLGAAAPTVDAGSGDRHRPARPAPRRPSGGTGPALVDRHRDRGARPVHAAAALDAAEHPRPGGRGLERGPRSADDGARARPGGPRRRRRRHRRPAPHHPRGSPRGPAGTRRGRGRRQHRRRAARWHRGRPAPTPLTSRPRLSVSAPPQAPGLAD